MYDIMIVGGGPAGLSAAITARQHGKDVVVITNDVTQSGLYKAEIIANYPGLPGISGKELSDKLTKHAADSGALLLKGQVSSMLAYEGAVNAAFGTEMLESKTAILATGVVQTSLLPGEEKFLGRGVSYCATCDGMLFRGRQVCAVCLTPEAEAEAAYLESIGCAVTRVYEKNLSINGEDKIESITAGGSEILCEGVFIFRRAIAPNLLLRGLEIKDGHIDTGRNCETTVPGVFAAGDCAGKPYQIAKAAGEGQVAALSAVDHIAKMEV
ncbi:MAG: NAD(P)/FAD-dependent oxidoreductase [Oscillospiraceae bacterium]|nr:NAD(P)/FAD-dependent oxidoreductase [Oscillospiraceae bacterium]